jgi:hypothetical protein
MGALGHEHDLADDRGPNPGTRQVTAPRGPSFGDYRLATVDDKMMNLPDHSIPLGKGSNVVPLAPPRETFASKMGGVSFRSAIFAKFEGPTNLWYLLHGIFEDPEVFPGFE